MTTERLTTTCQTCGTEAAAHATPSYIGAWLHKRLDQSGHGVTPAPDDETRRRELDAERLARRRARQPSPKPPFPECGTEAGHTRHRKLGERPCRWCVTAHSKAAHSRRRLSLDRSR